MRINKFCIFVFFLFLTNSSWAFASPSQTLTHLLQNLTTYQADFTQITQNKRGDILQKSYGKMALHRPGLFRWETLSPNQQLIIADGKNVWIDDKDLQQVTHQKQTIQQQQQSPGFLLSDSVNHLATQFLILMPNKNKLNFKLMPNLIHTKNSLFKFLVLNFNSQGGLDNMVIYDNLGQVTHIMFTQAKINPVLSPALFHFSHKT